MKMSNEHREQAEYLVAHNGKCPNTLCFHCVIKNLIGISNCNPSNAKDAATKFLNKE